MGYADFLKSLYPSSHNVEGEVYSAILGAIGYALDQYDPTRIIYSDAIPGVIVTVQNNLASEFSVTTATGTALDLHGFDWGVIRRSGETDNDYRSRILSMLPLYVNGPTVPGIEAIVRPFTGEVPIIFEYGPSAFTMGESAIGDAGFSTSTDVFTFEIHVQNPNNLSYDHLDMESAVSKAKLARSTAIIYHNGTDTSVAAESTTAVITITA